MAAWTRLKQLLVENKKKIGAIAMAGLVVGTGAFALLSVYDTATATMQVEKAIVLQEHNITIKHITDGNETLYGGETGYFNITILNYNREHNISVNIVGQITDGDKEGIQTICVDVNENNECGDGDQLFTYNSTSGQFSGVSIEVPKSDGTNPGSVTRKILVVLKDNAEPGEYQATIQVTP